MAELSDIEERALYAFMLKREEVVPWENIEALSGMTRDDILFHAATGVRKLQSDE